MRQHKLEEFRRIGWYFAGLLLFFSPFALYQKLALYLFDSTKMANIHTMCLRTPLLNLMNGNLANMISLSTFSFVVVLAAAFIAGPFFCGRLCPTGALPEYLSRLIPERWQLNWNQTVDPVPVRYGFLAGFLLAPFFGGTIAHAYCNFYLTEKILLIGINQDIGLLTSTVIITTFLWLGLFGIMARGGRGFCSFLCPVGTMQSFMHRMGTQFSFTYRICQNQTRCSGCQLCVRKCPMGAWQGDPVRHNINHCITCRQCVNVCPTGAISFCRSKNRMEMSKEEVLL